MLVVLVLLLVLLLSNIPDVDGAIGPLAHGLRLPLAGIERFDQVHHGGVAIVEGQSRVNRSLIQRLYSAISNSLGVLVVLLADRESARVLSDVEPDGHRRKSHFHEAIPPEHVRSINFLVLLLVVL